jgi:toxin-antitoxin system PIN domain toxin
LILPDVNVLVYAYREDAEAHQPFRDWLDEVINSEHPYGMSDLVLSGFIRVVTHPKVFREPTKASEAFAFAERILSQPQCVVIRPGPRHWNIFKRLCMECSAKGNLVPDAFLAALAIEHGCEWITTDRDYARFTGLRWRHPLN